MQADFQLYYVERHLTSSYPTWSDIWLPQARNWVLLYPLARQAVRLLTTEGSQHEMDSLANVAQPSIRPCGCYYLAFKTFHKMKCELNNVSAVGRWARTRCRTASSWSGATWPSTSSGATATPRAGRTCVSRAAPPAASRTACSCYATPSMGRTPVSTPEKYSNNFYRTIR